MLHKKYLFTIQIFSSLAIWSILVAALYYIAMENNFTPVQLGILSFCFSGAMALFNGLMAMFILPGKAKRYMVCGSIISIISLFPLFELRGTNAVFPVIFIIASCYSVISVGKDKILATISVKEQQTGEFIFKLLRFLGPMFGGVIAFLVDFKYVLMLDMIFYVISLLFILLLKRCENDKEIGRIDNRYMITEKYETNPIYMKIFLAMVFAITFCIQITDAQLVSIFKRSIDASALTIGVCIGISGIGVFFISMFLEKFMNKEIYFFIAFLCMGAVLFCAGFYIISVQSLSVYPMILLFFLGGIFWQIALSTLENMIKSYLDQKKKNHIFSIIGGILIISYSAGALSSGVFVETFGLGPVYFILASILFISVFTSVVIMKLIIRKVE